LREVALDHSEVVADAVAFHEVVAMEVLQMSKHLEHRTFPGSLPPRLRTYDLETANVVASLMKVKEELKSKRGSTLSYLH
jgi:creatinine amidohydrolase/Fe(II)-dependent formamide hydrolase-like protein